MFVLPLNDVHRLCHTIRSVSWVLLLLNENLKRRVNNRFITFPRQLASIWDFLAGYYLGLEKNNPSGN